MYRQRESALPASARYSPWGPEAGVLTAVLPRLPRLSLAPPVARPCPFAVLPASTALPVHRPPPSGGSPSGGSPSDRRSRDREIRGSPMSDTGSRRRTWLAGGGAVLAAALLATGCG